MSRPNESKPSATVRVTKDVRPRRPKIDKAVEVENCVRLLFKANVDAWCKENAPDTDKEARGNVIDNLTASFTSSIETLIDAATDSYLSTGFDDEGDDVVECPECEHEFELTEADIVGKSGNKAKCPECNHTFEVPDEVACPKCKGSFVVPEDIAEGEDVECPDCRHEFVLPSSGDSEA